MLATCSACESDKQADQTAAKHSHNGHTPQHLRRNPRTADQNKRWQKDAQASRDGTKSWMKQLGSWKLATDYRPCDQPNHSAIHGKEHIRWPAYEHANSPAYHRGSTHQE